MGRASDRDDGFDSSEVSDVLSVVTGEVEATMRQRVAQVVEEGLRDFLVGLVNMSTLEKAGTPQVMLRVRTIQTMLDDFRRTLGAQYDPVLTQIGRNIGFNFGLTLIRILRGPKRIPLTFETLLEFWAKFDSSAHMGHFEFTLQDHGGGSGAIEVEIKDLFLTLGYGIDDPLRHCPFMSGYLEGAIDTAALLWTRWIEGTHFAPPRVSWAVTRVENLGLEGNAVTRFVIGLKEEAHREAKDVFVGAVRACESGQWNEAMVKARICLEKALKSQVGASAESKISTGRLLEQLRIARAPLDYDRWQRSYGECSEFAHQEKSHNEIGTLNALFGVWCNLKDAELLELSADQLALLQSRKDRYMMS